MTALTLRIVTAAQPQGRDYFLWDDKLPGFGLRVFASGRKSYLIQYRVDGRTRRFTIGAHGPLTPEEARSRAKILLGKVEDGGDPSEDRATRNRDATISELCDTYLEAMEGQRKAASLAIDRGRIVRHVKPLLGARKLASITPGDVARFVADITRGKTATDVVTKPRGRAIVTGGSGTARRTLTLLSAILSWAAEQGYRADNPALGAKKPAERKMERFLSEPELKRLGAALAAAENDGANKMAINAIRLLTLTGCRKSEVTGLQWSFIDFNFGALRLPDSKTGAKVVHLGPPSLKILADLAEDEKRHETWVFPNAGRSGPTQALPGVWREVKKRAKLPDVRLHDLRHSFASIGAAGGNSLLMIGALLGHKDAKTTQRYAHLADSPVKAAAKTVANRIDAAMKGTSAKVVKLQKTSGADGR